MEDVLLVVVADLEEDEEVELEEETGRERDTVVPGVLDTAGVLEAVCSVFSVLIPVAETAFACLAAKLSLLI